MDSQIDTQPQNWIEVEKQNPVISVLVFDEKCENCMNHYNRFMQFMQTIPVSSACFAVLKIDDVFDDMEAKYKLKNQVPVYLFIEKGQEKQRIVQSDQEMDFETLVKPKLLEAIQKSQ